MAGQNRVDGPPQLPNPFAMHDSNLQDPFRLTFSEVSYHDIFNVLWPERMQVEHAVDREFDRPALCVRLALVVHVVSHSVLEADSRGRGAYWDRAAPSRLNLKLHRLRIFWRFNLERFNAPWH
jgi:hypothetical protein